jgi:hypothetical protein
MGNKRNSTEVSDVAYRKIAIGKARWWYRKYGTKIQIGRSLYTLILCDHLFYHGKACEGLCDTVNKEIYIQYHKGDKQLMETTILHEIVHASLGESCVTSILEWSEHMEEIIVESLTRDLAGMYSLNIRPEFRPA